MKIRDFLLWWGPVLVWSGLIFWLSGIPNLELSEGPSDFWLRKTAHMVVYAGLFLLVYRALIRDSFKIWRPKLVMLAFGLTVLYGMSDELHQSFVPTRNGNWFDVGIDALGATLAAIGLAWWGWWWRVLRDSLPEVASDE